MQASAIHGNKTQGARQKALDGFKSGHVRVLVATDIAARGIDVDNITHVINLDIPNEPESYVHRIGRTGRAGSGGIALSFCDGEERTYLRQIERLTGKKLEVVGAPPSGWAPRSDGPRADDRPRMEHRPRMEDRRPRMDDRPRMDAPRTDAPRVDAPRTDSPRPAPAAHGGAHAPTFGRGLRRA